MRFGGTLRRIIRRVLLANPRLGPVYLGKVDLANAYMRIWVRLEDTPSVGFPIPRKIPTDKNLVGFHVSLLMGYVDSALFLCLATKTITDMANAAMANRHRAPPHPLKELAGSPAPDDWPPTMADNKQWTLTSPEQRGHALAQVDVYLDDFISTCQGGPQKEDRRFAIFSGALTKSSDQT